MGTWDGKGTIPTKYISDSLKLEGNIFVKELYSPTLITSGMLLKVILMLHMLQFSSWI